MGAPALAAFPGRPDEGPGSDLADGKKARALNPAALAQKVLLERFAPPSVMVDSKGNILYFYGDTGRYLKPPQGQPVLSLTEMAREGTRTRGGRRAPHGRRARRPRSYVGASTSRQTAVSHR